MSVTVSEEEVRLCVNNQNKGSSLQDVFNKQAATALRLRTSTASQRIEKIKKLRDTVLAHRDEILKCAELDFKKPGAEVDLGEILPICIECNHAIRHLKSWMKPTKVWATLLTHGTSSSIECVPRGRCLIIGPFNYPVNLTLGPLVSAVAAGNTAILKPSEWTPNLSKIICKIVQETFSEDEVAVFEGDVEVAKELLALPFDHIFFTGSPQVGKIVMAAAAKNLTSVTLELGGKSPTIIDASANLAIAAKNVCFGKFANSGQTCIAPDYVYVHESVKDKWVEHCRKEIEQAYGGNTVEVQQKNAGLAHMVDVRHFKRVKTLLDDACSKGARTLVGGGHDESDCFLQPTLLDNIPSDCMLMEEEIFGPILPIFTYKDLDQVISKINAGPKPLALYVFSHNRRDINKIMKETVSGGVCVNGSLIQFLHGNLPFGGIGNSGLGNAHGKWGFKAFSHERAIVRVQVSLVSGLFSAGVMPNWLRSALTTAFKWV